MTPYYCIKLVAPDKRNQTFKQQEDGLWHGYAVGSNSAPDGRYIGDINSAHRQSFDFQSAFLLTSVGEYAL